MKNRQVTIKDLAKELEISASTVSRALKNHPDISQKTKDAVNELAKKLRYRPNAVALSLKSSRSKTIGVIIPEIVHYFFSSVISGIEDIAYDAGYNVMICQSNEKHEREVTNASMLLSSRVEGVLVSITKDKGGHDHLHQFSDQNVPIIFFDRFLDSIPADRVLIDDKKAGYKATNHLIDAGCKRVAHLCGPQTLDIGKNRLLGYVQALSEAELEVDKNRIVYADNFDSAKKATFSLLDQDPMPDGIFANNDLSAIGALKAIRSKGLRVPEDVALVGFSAGRFSDITDPTLSSVDQHGYEMGMEATKLLIQRINEEEEPKEYETKYIETNLVIRESSTRKR